jgi:quercetin dioxygenase-like cupin family protein
MSVQVEKETLMHRTVVMITIALVVGIAGGMIGKQVLVAQPQPFKRAALLKTELTEVAGKEAVVLTVEGAPGVVIGKHYHPGEEFVYVMEGSVTIEVEGKSPVTVNAGEVYHIPAKAVHGGKNPSTTAPFKVLTFGVFDKGQPDTTRVQ